PLGERAATRVAFSMFFPRSRWAQGQRGERDALPVFRSVVSRTSAWRTVGLARNSTRTCTADEALQAWGQVVSLAWGWTAGAATAAGAGPFQLEGASGLTRLTAERSAARAAGRGSTEARASPPLARSVFSSNVTTKRPLWMSGLFGFSTSAG